MAGKISNKSLIQILYFYIQLIHVSPYVNKISLELITPLGAMYVKEVYVIVYMKGLLTYFVRKQLKYSSVQLTEKAHMADISVE